MKNFMVLILLLTISSTSQANDSAAIAIDAVKSHEKVIHFLADKPSHDYQITYQQLQLGGVCGFVGCNWRQLVSVIIKSKSSNNPTKTILLLVEGLASSTYSKPTITFISIKKSLENKLIIID